MIKESLRYTIDALRLVIQDEVLLRKIKLLTDKIVSTYKNGGTVFTCGVGGSLSDHLNAELMNRFSLHREFPMNAIELSGNTALITAISNDYGFEYIFSKQIGALGRPGDLLIGISTSGRTEAVLRAVVKGNILGMNTVLVTGAAGPLVESTIHLQLPAWETGRIQELWLSILHAICREIDQYNLKENVL